MGTNDGIVEVTAAALAEKRIPMVCAMTGAPADTWRRFRFATLPLNEWMASGPFSIRNERRASGYLPLSRSSDTKLSLTAWVPVGVGVLGVVASIAAVVLLQSSSSSTAAGGGLLLLAGLVLLSLGGGSLLVLKPLVGPQGRVKYLQGESGQHETIVELSRVHPAFVAALRATLTVVR